tara:strand:+ start:377 stop:970 length:594 start_codon:yes stop_codon:yes gene_type:complete
MRSLASFCGFGLVSARVRVLFDLGLGLASGRAFGLGLAFRRLNQTTFHISWLGGGCQIRLWRVALILDRIMSNMLLATLLGLTTTLAALAFLPFSTFAVPLCLTLAVLAFLFLAALILLALRFGQHPQIVFRVLLKILCRNTVIGQLRIAGKLIVFLNHLLRRTAHFALRARAVKYAVDDIAAAVLLAVAVVLGPGP